MRGFGLWFAAIVLAAGQVSSVRAQTPGVPHGSVLTGMIQSPICSSDNFASGDAAGDLSGSFYVAFDCKDGSIAGGTWLVLVTSAAPDGTTEVIGTIRGQVLRGSFEADDTGERVVVRDVLLAITEGTGAYESIVAGTGSLEATSAPDAAPQFLGTLGLTF